MAVETTVTAKGRQSHDGAIFTVTVTAISTNHPITQVKVWDSAGKHIPGLAGSAVQINKEVKASCQLPGDPFPITVDVHEGAGGGVEKWEKVGDVHRHGPFYANGNPAEFGGVIPTKPDPQRQLTPEEAKKGPGKYKPGIG
jgi:hypothetical protein